VQIATGDGHEPFVQVGNSVTRAVHKIDLSSPVLDRNRGVARSGLEPPGGCTESPFIHFGVS